MDLVVVLDALGAAELLPLLGLRLLQLPQTSAPFVW